MQGKAQVIGFYRARQWAWVYLCLNSTEIMGWRFVSGLLSTVILVGLHPAQCCAELGAGGLQEHMDNMELLTLSTDQA